MLGWNAMAWYPVLIGAALKSIVVLAAAWLAAGLLRGRSAAARHLLWTAALTAILALPFLSAWLPELRVRAAAVFLTGPARAVFQATTATPSVSGTAQSTAHSGMARPFAGTRRNVDWRIWLMLVWAAGVAAAFARTLAGYGAAWRLRRSAKRSGDEGLCAALSATLGIRRAVNVLEAGTGTMPMTFGLARADILVPPEASEWSVERRRMVLLHEPGACAPCDPATHLLARVAMNIYWWNPLAWIAWREFLKERERAADDLVLNAGERASEYAGHLFEVARTLQAAPAIGWAAVAMARRSQLEGRLLAILDSGVNRAASGRASVLMAAVLGVALIAPLAALRGQQKPEEAVPHNPTDVETCHARSPCGTRLSEVGGCREGCCPVAGIRCGNNEFLKAAASVRAEIFGEQSVEHGRRLDKTGGIRGAASPETVRGGALSVGCPDIAGSARSGARSDSSRDRCPSEKRLRASRRTF